ncbi:hypothetical protein [Actinoplanes sp. NPDC026619]|uniref:hypothetical protein n=1 Tax=Actinoplanes sp. NPDC026619 TaxID=3155798 RepID=UPI0033D73309
MVVDLVNTVAGLLGLALTALTLTRVRAVRRAQRDERTLIRTLYGTDAAATRIRAAASHLARSRDAKARELAQDLILFSGQIEGVSRALDSDGRAASATGAVELKEEGYFTSEFLAEVVAGARQAIDVLMYRPITIATAPVLAALRDAAERGVEIRMLALSVEATDEVLSHGATVMPAAAVYQPEQLRPQLLEAERRIAIHVKTWPAAAQRRLGYRRYRTPPGPHLIRADRVISAGFVDLQSGPMPVRFDERVFIQLPADGKLGTHFTSHFEVVWASAEPAPMQ